MQSLKEIVHRTGMTELAVARLQAEAELTADHEPRIRRLEGMAAKVMGAAFVGSFIVPLLTKLAGCGG